MSSYLVNCCQCGNEIYEDPYQCFCIWTYDTGDIGSGYLCETCRERIVKHAGLEKIVNPQNCRERYSRNRMDGGYKMTPKEVMRKAIETYGEEAQLWMVAEEMSELQKEICKYKRGKKNQEEMTDEIADVLIMIEQLSIICGITIDSVRERIDYKIDRLEERLNATGDYGGLK